ncbi:hypothetical protein SAMN05216298_0105 [Glycomyces sambucus]|uniref:Prenyltransferase and squalene oxidase repeat-containing protein n=1 Tax=Glycomyces sambucus TaxID=380244 RepID=A0A1G9N3X0_9ACTN|nr:hypothetical protein [Glycomyces sambucus]SDL81266.1 hypothetical protein SAMN05216298_0105 [Glycomyces sambucus]
MRQLAGRLLTAAALPVTLLSVAVPAHAQSAPFEQPAEAAASWLAAQSDGTAWNQDPATSLDAVLGLLAARVGGDQVEATLQWLNDPAVLDPYVNTAADGAAGFNAGSAGKVMYTVATAGGDPTDFGGVKLADEVAAAQTANGTYGDGTAGSTAWAVLGLSRTDTPAAATAAAGLAAVQCPDGGFNYADVDGGDDCVSDPDTTGLAVSALVALGEPGAASLEAAVAWLESAQAEDGGFDGGFGANANSTAMAAQALLAADRSEAAGRAVAFLLTLQFDCSSDEPGAFMYTDPEDPDFGEATRLLATAQAIVPVSGQNLATLDASGADSEVPANGCEAADAGDATTAAADEDESGSSWLPWAIVAAVVVIGALILVFALRARRGGDAAGNGAAGSAPAAGASTTADEAAGSAATDEVKDAETADESGAEGPASGEPEADGSDEGKDK